MNYFTSKTFFSLNYQGEVIPANELDKEKLNKFASEEEAVQSAESEIAYFDALREDNADMFYPSVVVLVLEGDNFKVLSTHE